MNFKFIEKFIEKTNLLIQNNKNNTCFHYIVKNQLWKKYKDILIKKKLNIFLINKKNECPYDYVKKEDHDEFIKLIINSYIYRLKNYKKNWIWIKMILYVVKI